jgi:hypothetical protein
MTAYERPLDSARDDMAMGVLCADAVRAILSGSVKHKMVSHFIRFVMGSCR